MADKAIEHKLGEIFPDCRRQIVEYTETIAAGDYLKITGVTSEPERYPKVAKQTAATAPRFVAAYPGKNGDLEEAIIQGTTKVTFGATLGAGDRIGVKSNETLKDITANTSHSCGFTISLGVDGDTGLIYFVGYTA